MINLRDRSNFELLSEIGLGTRKWEEREFKIQLACSQFTVEKIVASLRNLNLKNLMTRTTRWYLMLFWLKEDSVGIPILMY